MQLPVIIPLVIVTYNSPDYKGDTLAITPIDSLSLTTFLITLANITHPTFVNINLYNLYCIIFTNSNIEDSFKEYNNLL